MRLRDAGATKGEIYNLITSASPNLFRPPQSISYSLLAQKCALLFICRAVNRSIFLRKYLYINKNEMKILTAPQSLTWINNKENLTVGFGSLLLITSLTVVEGDMKISRFYLFWKILKEKSVRMFTCVLLVIPF